MLYQIIMSYLVVGVLVVLWRYDYITKIAIEVLNEYSHLTLLWPQGYMENYVNFIMPCFFILLWPFLLLLEEED